jgi:hypothetical protein
MPIRQGECLPFLACTYEEMLDVLFTRFGFTVSAAWSQGGGSEQEVAALEQMAEVAIAN